MLARVKSLSIKYQKTKIYGRNSTVGHTGSGFCNVAKACGQTHLWHDWETNYGKWTVRPKRDRKTSVEATVREAGSPHCTGTPVSVG